MEHLNGLVELFAVVFSLSLPIVAIIMVFTTEIKKRRNDTELRLALIKQGTDAETAKILIERQQQKKGKDKYSALRWGCILIGVGLGALCNALLGISPKDNVYFWLVVAAGMGIGLLVSFIIEYMLTKKEQIEKMPEETQIE